MPVHGVILVGLIGLLAQLTAGSLGMGYGVITTSALLAVGLGPAVASATVHFAELGTATALGAAHWRMRNIDWPLVGRLAGPGALGAFSGALLLTHLSVRFAGVIMAVILLCIGSYIMVRFSVRPPRAPVAARSRLSAQLLAPLGLLGGFLDATGGGGWGPVTTTALLSSGRIEPRLVVGSVDAAKAIVS
ncbi:MAG: sulfite exporter TauE/SafE family protein, partial [Nostocoides sp.]